MNKRVRSVACRP